MSEKMLSPRLDLTGINVILDRVEEVLQKGFEKHNRDLLTDHRTFLALIAFGISGFLSCGFNQETLEEVLSQLIQQTVENKKLLDLLNIEEPSGGLN